MEDRLPIQLCLLVTTQELGRVSVVGKQDVGEVQVQQPTECFGDHCLRGCLFPFDDDTAGSRGEYDQHFEE